jgi:hypothetical protein
MLCANGHPDQDNPSENYHFHPNFFCAKKFTLHHLILRLTAVHLPANAMAQMVRVLG